MFEPFTPRFAQNQREIVHDKSEGQLPNLSAPHRILQHLPRFRFEVAQNALWFGVDDLDGTVQEEKIYHMAGARTPEAMTTREVSRLIVAAGRRPVERDTFYNVIRADQDVNVVQTSYPAAP